MSVHLNDNFRRELKQWRQENNPVRKIRRNIDPNLSRKEFADIVGCHVTTAGWRENSPDGIPPRFTKYGDKLIELAGLFGVPVGELEEWGKKSRDYYKALKQRYSE